MRGSCTKYGITTEPCFIEIGIGAPTGRLAEEDDVVRLYIHGMYASTLPSLSHVARRISTSLTTICPNTPRSSSVQHGILRNEKRHFLYPNQMTSKLRRILLVSSVKHISKSEPFTDAFDSHQSQRYILSQLHFVSTGIARSHRSKTRVDLFDNQDSRSAESTSFVVNEKGVRWLSNRFCRG